VQFYEEVISMLNILFVSSEVAPFSKTGGLADVSGSLPKALSELGVKVTVATPLYRMVDRAKSGLKKWDKILNINLGGTEKNFEVWECRTDENVRVLFLGNDEFFDREFLYTAPTGDYPDNYSRFAFFSYALIELIKELDPQPSIIHCNDWQTALLPLYNSEFLFGSLKTLLTIHNLGYQGLFPPNIIPQIGLDWSLFNPEDIEFYGKVNFLKAGLISASRITTVSPKYAVEIQHHEFGCGLDGVLRKRSGILSGIINGVDYSVWDPANDGYIVSQYSAANLKGKKLCKKELQKESGFPLNPDTPLIGMITRIAGQKGLDLVALAMDELVKLNLQIIILGTGEKPLEDMLIESSSKYRHNVAVKIAFDDRLAHLIEAGSDFFLMPSRYEPCGLNQIYSFRYGTLPIVHAVGGLEDTVVDIDENPKEGNGFKFRIYSMNSMIEKIARAIDLYRQRKKMDEVVKRVMTLDFSWKESAKKYIELYKEI
jgi:starch synthase